MHGEIFKAGPKFLNIYRQFQIAYEFIAIPFGITQRALFTAAERRTCGVERSKHTALRQAAPTHARTTARMHALD